MATDGYSGEYATLMVYAKEVGIPPAYIRGVIYYLDLNLPIINGAIVVDRPSRRKLDTIVRKIRATMVRDGRIGARGRSRPRRPTTA